METVHTDILLLNKLQKGDAKAFDALFRKYYPLLCAYGRRFVCVESAEEIAQDAMLWLWEHREEEIIRTSLVKYLLKVVYRKALNRLEQEQVKLNADTRFYQDVVENVLEETDLCEVNNLSRKLNEAIACLPDTYREAFVMHRFKDMTYKEIAARLDVSVKTVDYRIQQALKLLALELKDYLPLLLFLFANKA
ncbi:MAG TPA: RNA polymerase sigma-70 factor [Candidatus Bacteroides merdavium]|uniref:RNA polymerase sigma-70 factor n=1 Tax=Candidatus Bacteroides merdavium TaxID=2838472 RepID=A0A9D2KCY0_9BACE|nr:RNA polymerase sigma-70 factor [Candidatus Bacteroides merdavium]